MLLNINLNKQGTLKRKTRILAEPNPKTGKKLYDNARKLVIHFFQQNEYSRCCPGMKDFVLVRTNTGRIKDQTHLLVLNI